MTQNKNNIIAEDTRTRLAKFLPKALENALASYKHISIKKPEDMQDENGKRELDHLSHKKHQEACKVALAHVELLVKLAVRVDLSGSKPTSNVSNEELNIMLEKANVEISNNNKQNNNKQ